MEIKNIYILKQSESSYSSGWISNKDYRTSFFNTTKKKIEDIIKTWDKKRTKNFTEIEHFFNLTKKTDKIKLCQYFLTTSLKNIPTCIEKLLELNLIDITVNNKPIILED